MKTITHIHIITMNAQGSLVYPISKTGVQVEMPFGLPPSYRGMPNTNDMLESLFSYTNLTREHIATTSIFHSTTNKTFDNKTIKSTSLLFAIEVNAKATEDGVLTGEHSMFPQWIFSDNQRIPDQVLRNFVRAQMAVDERLASVNKFHTIASIPVDEHDNFIIPKVGSDIHAVAYPEEDATIHTVDLLHKEVVSSFDPEVYPDVTTVYHDDPECCLSLISIYNVPYGTEFSHQRYDRDYKAVSRSAYVERIYGATVHQQYIMTLAALYMRPCTRRYNIKVS